MTANKGFAPLNRLQDFEPRTFATYKWFRYLLTSAMNRLVDAIVLEYGRRNEVVSGGVVSEGASLAAGALFADVTAMVACLGGRLYDIAAISDDDLLVTAGNVGQPIYSDGTSAAALSLGTDETAYVTVVVCNSDGAGGLDTDDGGTALLVAIVNGTSATYENQTAHLTSQEIEAALAAATGVHDDASLSWAHVCRILFDENTGSPQTTIVMNRNNVLGV